MTVAELRDYITRRKNLKISIVKGGKNACTRSRIRIVLLCHYNYRLYANLFFYAKSLYVSSVNASLQYANSVTAILLYANIPIAISANAERQSL